MSRPEGAGGKRRAGDELRNRQARPMKLLWETRLSWEHRPQTACQTLVDGGTIHQSLEIGRCIKNFTDCANTRLI